MNALVAIAAGAIGSLLTLGAAWLVSFFAADRETQVNDRRIADLDADLERWVVDDDVRLRRELRAERQALSARNLLYSGEYAHRLGLAKERALQAYRDQELRAERELALIRDREVWRHEFWRKRRNRPRRTLTTPERALPILDVWRSPSSPPESTDAPVAVDDPTVRTMDEALTQVRTSPKDYT